METYRASNNKIIDTNRMDCILDLDYDGCYGPVESALYRTRRSHQWYIVSESSWAGEGSVSSADAISLKEAAELIMEHDPDEIASYPELADYVAQVIDD